jgi:outer membrane protein assembly factor BamB
LFVVRCHWSLIIGQWSVDGNQQSTINNQQSAINNPQSAIRFRPCAGRAADHNDLMKTAPAQGHASFFILPFLLVLNALTPAGAANWPAWRGPHGDGRCGETNLPLRWGTNENVRWRVPLPDRGNSTPVVWGSRVFVTQAVAREGRRALMCFDRATGALLWQEGTKYEGQELTHATNPHCGSSPVTDGERVVAWYGSAGLSCYGLAGQKLWQRDLGPQRHIWGNASSPILHGDLCILNFGPGEPSFLLAVDKKTGRDVWKVTEPNADSGEEKPGVAKAAWTGSWSTPLVVNTGAREEMLLSWPKRLVAFEPKTGNELWTCAGLNPLAYTSPLYDPARNIAVAMGGFNGMALAVKAGGAGDVTESRRLWHHPRTKQRIGSGVIHDGYIYIHNDPGVAECWELETGKLVWEERLRGAAAKNDSWSSMVLAGDRLYVINQGGDAFVLRASPKFEVLATNSIGETTMASLVPSDGEIFIRTYQHLWCIGARRP